MTHSEATQSSSAESLNKRGNPCGLCGTNHGAGPCSQATFAECEHDWRLHKSEQETSYPPAPDPWTTNVAIKTVGMTTTYDTWYCTKCRRIERLARV